MLRFRKPIKIQAPKAIITIPLGVVAGSVKKKRSDSFIPEIPAKRKAAQQTGFGGVIKFILQFKEAFWKSEQTETLAGRKLKNLGFLFSRAGIPTWWTQLPDESPILTGWIAGPDSDKYLAAARHLLKEHEFMALFSRKDGAGKNC